MSIRPEMGFLQSYVTTFVPREDITTRWLALFGAVIATNESGMIESVIEGGRRYAIEHSQFYEIVLQSYLFLGFPRMLTAAESLDKALGSFNRQTFQEPLEETPSVNWFVRGLDLCKKVYGESFEPLRNRVESMAPEVYHWMILEGYGKVLSRPGLSIIDRELANVAMLLADDREQQLHSHMRGALNVGASPLLLRQVITDLSVFQAGHATALRVLSRMKVA